MDSLIKTPILDTLQDYLSKDPIRLHVPFHTGITNNDVFTKELYKLDISEVSGYDTTGESNPIYLSEKITAAYFNTFHTFYLIGGASIGLVAATIALNKFGKKVLIARNVHKSVINGIILAGLEPVWIDIEYLDEWGIFLRVNPDVLEKLILKNNDIAGCVIVSPTYEGLVSNVKEIAEICHKKGIPLIVDEAHGAHLYVIAKRAKPDEAIPINDSITLDSAINLGADIVIQSWHKSLGSLTQTGVLHLVNEFFFTYNDIKRSLDLVSSTSPSFLLLLSLELTRKYLVETKGLFLLDLLRHAIFFRNEVSKIKNIVCFNNDDYFKVYLKHESINGTDFAYELYKSYCIEVESANETGLLMQLGFSFNKRTANKVLSVFSEMSSKETISCKSNKIPKLKPQTSKLKLMPREAFIFGFSREEKEIHSELEAPCPPGYVINLPGSMKYEA